MDKNQNILVGISYTGCASFKPFKVCIVLHQTKAMHQRLKTASVIVLISCAVWSCSTKDAQVSTADTSLAALNLPAAPYNYATENWPSYFTQNTFPGPGQVAATSTINTPVSNPITNHGATLGRVLFYDKNLSINRTISCASCHNPSLGFSDSAVLSKGFNGGSTRRHSMPLVNAILYTRGRFFWDERAATLEEQVLQPFQDPVEMGMTIPTLLERVREKSYYATLFNNAFGSTDITSNRVSLALAQFVRSIVSYNSKYDAGRALVQNPAQAFPNFTASENNGKNFFFQPINAGGGGCLGCHGTEAFVAPNRGGTVNGIDAVSTTDRGIIEAIPNNNQLEGAFKVTSLRNIELTAPYMHDGRFTSLTEVIEHYNSGIRNHRNLDPILKTPQGTPVRLNMTAQQKTDLLNFLKTLTDASVATNPKYTNPFR